MGYNLKVLKLNQYKSHHLYS